MKDIFALEPSPKYPRMSLTSSHIRISLNTLKVIICGRRCSLRGIYGIWMDAKLCQKPEFPRFYDFVRKKLDNNVSPLRALEVVMFLNARKF